MSLASNKRSIVLCVSNSFDDSLSWKCRGVCFNDSSTRLLVVGLPILKAALICKILDWTGLF